MKMKYNATDKPEDLTRDSGSTPQIIPDEFFVSLFGFCNCLKAGNRSMAAYNLREMQQACVGFSADVFRLAYVSIVNCFAQHLGAEYVMPRLVEVPQTVEAGFERIGAMAKECFEKLDASKNASDRFKHEVIKILQEEFSNPLLSVAMLADRLGISSSYLSRRFKEKTGATLFSYIDEIRISRAKQLLYETDTPVKEIVRMVGYNDINNFNRKFKAKTGKTPTVYRGR